MLPGRRLGGAGGAPVQNRADFSRLHLATFLTSRPACLRRQTVGALRRAGAGSAAVIMGSLPHTLTAGLMVRRKLESCVVKSPPWKLQCEGGKNVFLL